MRRLHRWWRLVALEADPGQPLEPFRQVPVPVAEEGHRGGQQYPADERRVDQDRRREADPELLQVEEAERRETAKTPNMTKAALLTVPAVLEIAWRTASCVLIPEL